MVFLMFVMLLIPLYRVCNIPKKKKPLVLFLFVFMMTVFVALSTTILFLVINGIITKLTNFIAYWSVTVPRVRR